MEEFFQRAAHYRSMDMRLGSLTRFFAAAAWINQLLGDLARRRVFGVSSLCLLRELGRHLMIENNHMISKISTGFLPLPVCILDGQLVDREQQVAEQFLMAIRQSDPDLHRTACHEIDKLLNNSWFRLAIPVLPAPLASIGRLSRIQPLQFAKTAHREAIGYALIRSIGHGPRRRGHSSTLGSGRRLKRGA
jgi:hypothetical protein